MSALQGTDFQEELNSQLISLEWRIKSLAKHMKIAIKGKNGCVAKYNFRFEEEREIKLIKSKIKAVEEKLKEVTLDDYESNIYSKNLKQLIIDLENKKKSANQQAWLGLAWLCLHNAKKENTDCNIRLTFHYLLHAREAYGVANSEYSNFKLFLNVSEKGRDVIKIKTQNREDIILTLAKNLQHTRQKKLSINAMANKIRERWLTLKSENSEIEKLFGHKIPSNKMLRLILAVNINSW